MKNLDSLISAGVAGTTTAGLSNQIIPPLNEPIVITVIRLLLPSIVSVITYFLHSKIKDKNNSNNNINQPNNF